MRSTFARARGRVVRAAHGWSRPRFVLGLTLSVGLAADGGCVGLGVGRDDGGSGGSSAGAGGGSGGLQTNPLGQADIAGFVAAHNQARAGGLVPEASPPLPPVSWDAVLADVAYNYLSKCVSVGASLVDHNPNRTADYKALGGADYVGENIFATTGPNVTAAEAVNNWMEEAQVYDYATNASTTGTEVGHYTQVVWRSSVRIGCAIVDCPNVLYHNSVLCDYAPGGNYVGQRPY